ncbi:hypothetical protein EXS74_02730 [Candidatus Woesearchaeota archaeon]|nr:hypothetical protein [Candidatus Woesearchaeota archaeon]
MNKKAELTMETVIVLILLLIVLIAVALIFRSQIISFVNSISGVSSGLNTDLAKATDALSP